MANRKMLKIGEASELLGVTPATLRAWERTGELLPARKSKAGTRCCLESDLLGVGNQSAPTVRYARVSTTKQKANLIDALTDDEAKPAAEQRSLL